MSKVNLEILFPIIINTLNSHVQMIIHSEGCIPDAKEPAYNLIKKPLDIKKFLKKLFVLNK